MMSAAAERFNTVTVTGKSGDDPCSSSSAQYMVKLLCQKSIAIADDILVMYLPDFCIDRSTVQSGNPQVQLVQDLRPDLSFQRHTFFFLWLRTALLSDV